MRKPAAQKSSKDTGSNYSFAIEELIAVLTLALDTLLDTLEEGRLSSLEISTFPDLLIFSNLSLSTEGRSMNGSFDFA